MLDLKLLRKEPEKVEKAIKNRILDISLDSFLELDKSRRELLFESEQLKAKQNAVSKQVPAMKKQGKDTTALFEEMKNLSNKIKQIDVKIRDVNNEIQNFLLTIPNIPDVSVPVGASDEENIVVRYWGEPRKFDFEPKPHWEIGQQLDILDSEKASKVTGTRFTFYKKAGATLERAITNYFLDTHIKNGYTEVFPPFMVHRNSMIGTGQLPKFEEDAFKVENTDYFLIPTAEVPVTNMYREQILNIIDRTIYHVAYSACFRSEAGSAGRDTRGLIRQHQFNKVELVKFTTLNFI